MNREGSLKRIKFDHFLWTSQHINNCVKSVLVQSIELVHMHSYNVCMLLHMEHLNNDIR